MTDHHAAAEAVRAIMDTKTSRPQAEAPTLPVAETTFSLDDVQLHDLCYHAATRYLHRQYGMTKERSHTHAGRIAAMAVVAAWAEHSHEPEPQPEGDDGE